MSCSYYQYTECIHKLHRRRNKNKSSLKNQHGISFFEFTLDSLPLADEKFWNLNNSMLKFSGTERMELGTAVFPSQNGITEFSHSSLTPILYYPSQDQYWHQLSWLPEYNFPFYFLSYSMKKDYWNKLGEIKTRKSRRSCFIKEFTKYQWLYGNKWRNTLKRLFSP